MAVDKKQQDKISDIGKFDFLKASKIFAAVSFALTFASIVVIMIDGFNYGIDFAGGTEVQVQFQSEVEAGRVRKFAESMGYTNAQVQSLGENNEYLIRLESVEGANDKETNKLLNAMIAKVTEGLKTSFTSEGALVRRVDSVGPQVGSELKRNGLLAVFYSLLMILIYVGLRFDYKYAPGAVFCLFHDAIITLGIFSLFGREVNVQTMAAVLTIIGYSLNDTIVTFDRIRENTVTYRDNTFTFIINRSLNDVLSRTLLTSVTTMIAVAAMYILAGGVIQDFAFTLGIGVIVGTYSSIYVASPLVLLVDRLQKSKAAA
ncbi:MAG: protein translocase subunit SecF [Bdellovibrionales bacterium]|nr:protein translocase subunit SecF [Bdellovibrionales bacterium]